MFVMLQGILFVQPTIANTITSGRSLLDIVFGVCRVQFCGGYVKKAGTKGFTDESREDMAETLAMFAFDVLL